MLLFQWNNLHAVKATSFQFGSGVTVMDIDLNKFIYYLGWTSPETRVELTLSCGSPYILNPITTTGQPPSYRQFFSLTYIGNGRVLLFGGFTDGKVVRFAIPGIPGKTRHTRKPGWLYNDLYILNISNWEWTRVTSCGVLPPPIEGHCAWVSSDCTSLWVFGGTTTVYDEFPTNLFFHFDLQTLEWSNITDSICPSPRTHFTVNVIKNKAFIFGGRFNGNETLTHASSNIPKVDTLQWTLIDSYGFRLPLSCHKSTTLNSKIYYFYGTYMEKYYGRWHGAQIFDTNTSTWSIIPYLLSQTYENCISVDTLENHIISFTTPRDVWDLPSQEKSFGRIAIINIPNVPELRTLCIDFISKYLETADIFGLKRLPTEIVNMVVSQLIILKKMNHNILKKLKQTCFTKLDFTGFNSFPSQNRLTDDLVTKIKGSCLTELYLNNSLSLTVFSLTQLYKLLNLTTLSLVGCTNISFMPSLCSHDQCIFSTYLSTCDISIMGCDLALVESSIIPLVNGLYKDYYQRGLEVFVLSKFSVLLLPQKIENLDLSHLTHLRSLSPLSKLGSLQKLSLLGSSFIWSDFWTILARLTSLRALHLTLCRNELITLSGIADALSPLVELEILELKGLGECDTTYFHNFHKLKTILW